MHSSIPRTETIGLAMGTVGKVEAVEAAATVAELVTETTTGRGTMLGTIIASTTEDIKTTEPADTTEIEDTTVAGISKTQTTATAHKTTTPSSGTRGGSQMSKTYCSSRVATDRTHSRSPTCSSTGRSMQINTTLETISNQSLMVRDRPRNK
uniref:(northern house mosquito) hypothetical protein n=1 Tax=Culex pipiens TaxID=7175 RepID=A0A8D8AMJ3_CULPI